MRRALQRARSKRTQAINRTLTHVDGTLSAINETLTTAAKRRHITVTCQTVLQQQITGLRGQVAALRK
jgi:hypothetical protein